MGAINYPSLQQLSESFNLTIKGDTNKVIHGLAPLESANSSQIAFLVNPLYRKDALTSQAGCIIVNDSDYEFLLANETINSRSYLISKNPYAAFARIAQFFEKLNIKEVSSGIHPTAVISPKAIVPASCHIGPYCNIESDVVLGEGVVLKAHVNIAYGSKVGDGSVIAPMVSIYHACEIGKHAIIHSGVVIGADGFGFAPEFTASGGEWVKIPQTGAVKIGNDVEIGANTTIDRGALEDTIIEDGCKIDNQVQIGHNVRVGAFTVIAGCAAIAGSTKVGKMCIIGGSANLAGHLSIADRTTISGGTSITRTIEEPGQHFTSVFPFTTHAEWEKNAAIVRGLDKIRKRIKTLEQK